MTRGVHLYCTAIDRNAVHAERLADGILRLRPRKPLHVAFFVGIDLFSRLMASQLVPRLLAAGHMPFLYLPVHKGSQRPQLFELRELAFYARHLLQAHIIPHSGSDFAAAGPCMTVQQLRARYGVLVESVPDVNDPAFVRSLATHHIDLGFSLRCYQRFKTDALGGALCHLHGPHDAARRGAHTVLRRGDARPPNLLLVCPPARVVPHVRGAHCHRARRGLGAAAWSKLDRVEGLVLCRR